MLKCLYTHRVLITDCGRTSHKLAQTTLDQSIHEGLEDASNTSNASMHLYQHCPCQVQGAAHKTTIPSIKTLTQCVREKACGRNHSYTVNREHITFEDIIQHSTLTSRFHDTQTLQYTVNFTVDTIQSIKLIKVHFWIHCQSSKYYYDITFCNLTSPRIHPNKLLS